MPGTRIHGLVKVHGSKPTRHRYGLPYCPRARLARRGAFYSDDPLTLIVFELDVDAIEAAGIEAHWELADGELFPHICGPLRPEFVVSVTRLVRG